MQKIFNFQQQKKFGDQGEADFFKYYAVLGIKKENGRKWDFSMDGQGIEVKQDSYPMSKTPNLFIEKFSNIETGKKGGIYRAHNDKVKYFVYYYANDGVFLWYDVELLYKFIVKNEDDFVKKVIRNKNYKSEGLLVPRKCVESFLVRNDVFG